MLANSLFEKFQAVGVQCLHSDTLIKIIAVDLGRNATRIDPCDQRWRSLDAYRHHIVIVDAIDLLLQGFRAAIPAL